MFWGYPLTRYHLALERTRHIFNRARFFTALIIALNFWVWAIFWIVRARTFLLLVRGFNGPVLFWRALPGRADLFFWLGVLFFSYSWYLSAREHETTGAVEHFDYQGISAGGANLPLNTGDKPAWSAALALPRQRRLDIARAFTIEARAAVARGYQIADAHGDKVVTPVHLFYALLSFNRVGNIFIRLGISASQLKQEIAPLFAIDNRHLSPAFTASVGPEAWQTLFLAYEDAYQAHQSYVSVTEILEAVIAQSPALQELLFDLGIDQKKLANVVEWARIRERLHREYVQFRGRARHRSTHGMDKAMTALATPYLNRFSEDLTLMAQFGYTEACVARQHEIDEVFRVVDGGASSVLLVGEYGVGKKSIVEGIAQKMVAGDVPPRLNDKRLVRLSTSALLAGATPTEAMERLLRIFQEIGRARNIILCLHNIHELVDVASTIAEHLTGGAFLTIATTTTEAYAQVIVNSNLSNVFTKVEVREMDENQAIQVLESKVGVAEYKHQVFFSYAAIEKAVGLAKRYVHENVLPGNALEIMNEAATFARNRKGVNALVTADEVASVVAEKTHIPVTTVTADETSKLLHLEAALHERVIGQNEAVDLVANALRRARAQIRATTRPIANFLFLGPTGVGKTELAKTIAAVYFGGEERMVRLDMSEYQEKGSVYRLIGAPGQKGTGILTEAVRQHPFTLLLLDEIEKADKDVLNLFLQVMDDGRLTDSTGRAVDFTNIILIATSNAGTSYVAEQMRAGLASEAIKDRLLHGELKENFRPEFLNRFDGIVLFKPLSAEDIKQVAALMLKRVATDLEAKGITLQIADGALDFLASVGFDPEFGARPMRRALEERIENKLAGLILEGKLKRRDAVSLGADGNLVVQTQ